MFNIVGQVTSLDTPQGDFDYTYNTWGQPYQMTDDSGTWTSLYDSYHRANGMTNPWSETTGVTFDSAGRVNRKNLPNGMYETYTFDDRSRVEEVKTYNSSNALQDTKAYVWDEASRITQATEGGVATTYGYDDIDQLTSESRTGYSASYTYDANGNRLTRTVGGTTETYHYDDADKLTYISVGETTTKSYSYDDCGRTTSVTTGAGTTSFTYDYDGKVTGISYPGSVSDSFGYNGLGARVSTSGTNGSRTFRRAGIGVTSSVLDDGTKKYTPGVSSRQGSTSTFQHSGLKNATEQSNSSQSVTATKKYDAFGNTVSSSGTWHGPFGYAGSYGYQEDPNGLKLLGHRYYDSSTGRFITSDPIGDGSNWYGYCSNNPVTSADPLGLMAAWITNVAKGSGVALFAVGLWALLEKVMDTGKVIAKGYEDQHRIALEEDGNTETEAIRLQAAQEATVDGWNQVGDLVEEQLVATYGPGGMWGRVGGGRGTPPWIQGPGKFNPSAQEAVGKVTRGMVLVPDFFDTDYDQFKKYKKLAGTLAEKLGDPGHRFDLRSGLRR